MELKDKIRKLKGRVSEVEDDLDSLEERVRRLERGNRPAADPQAATANSLFGIFGLQPGVGALPPLGTRLSKEDTVTLAKGLAVGLGFKNAGPLVDAFFNAAIPEEEPQAAEQKAEPEHPEEE